MLTNIVNVYRTFAQNIQYSNLMVDFINDRVLPCKKMNVYAEIPVTNQYLKTVIKDLQHPTMEGRLNAVYQLERIAHNYLQYHWLIMEVICTFIRNHAANISLSRSDNSSTLIMQAALDVIAKRNIKHDPENQQLDLSYVDMRGANLRQGNLEGANLYRVNLAGANLSEANLCGTILTAANLSGANLAGANLSLSILSAANLTGANLSGANLAGANLYLASLSEVILHETRLNGANLREVKFTTSNSHTLCTQHPKSTSENESDN
ncbi:pentapeptide repeat-containing protein [Anabaena azotica]|uniref:Pentapeptide repeat-containing protein n=1 Tax=Anabaena azotica FACHB-119 TaxID=947527 RepID=A0ABR8D009_9NOST|nr:pentapeptide repeat-containing protein [Anabaena azotica]MBD2500478.1 pentapeptide repeat-containing protein [Anabaena azotica FACHB-119]